MIYVKTFRGISMLLGRVAADRPRNPFSLRSFFPYIEPALRVDTLKLMVILGASYLLSFVDPSKMYHSIRGQSMVKLYVIFNVCEVADKLLCSFGLDIMNSFLSFDDVKDRAKVTAIISSKIPTKVTSPKLPSLNISTSISKNTFRPNSGQNTTNDLMFPLLSPLANDALATTRHLRPLTHFLLAVLYAATHSLVLFYQVITLNVAINSHNNALLTLLLSNQFVEIKGSVFKKFEKENLFQLSCAEMVERFHIFMFCVIIGVRNVLEFSLGDVSTASTVALEGSKSIFPTHLLSHAWTLLSSGTFLLLETILAPLLAIFFSEVCVDWLKHSFITKFNGIIPDVYKTFLDILCHDYKKLYYRNLGSNGKNGTKSEKTSWKLLHFIPMRTAAVALKIGFSPIPITCLIIRFALHIINASQVSLSSLVPHFFSVFFLYSSVPLDFCFFVLIFACSLLSFKLILDVCLAHFVAHHEDHLPYPKEE